MTNNLIISEAGGGTFGIGPARYLSLLSEQTAFAPVAAIGTSIGAVDMALLACGVTPADLYKFHVEHSSDVFGKKNLKYTLFKYGSKYDDAAIMELLKSLCNRKMKDTVFPLYTVAWNTLTKSIKVFSSKSDPDVYVWYAARASMAAATYFTPVDNIYNDGGMACNEPAALGLSKSLLDGYIASGDNVRVLDLVTSGTTSDGKKISNDAFITTQLTDVILPAITSGNSADTEVLLQAFREVSSGKTQYYRVAPSSPDWDLDAVSHNPDITKIWEDQFALDRVSVTEFVRPSL